MHLLICTLPMLALPVVSQGAEQNVFLAPCRGHTLHCSVTRSAASPVDSTNIMQVVLIGVLVASSSHLISHSLPFYSSSSLTCAPHFLSPRKRSSLSPSQMQQAWRSLLMMFLKETWTSSSSTSR